MRALMNPNYKTPVIDGEQITDGIDISTWTINAPGMNLTYSVWDFAGQTVYYNTHQVQACFPIMSQVQACFPIMRKWTKSLFKVPCKKSKK